MPCPGRSTCSAARSARSTWTGAVDGAWDTTTGNWSTGAYVDGNIVLFNNSGANTNPITVAAGGVSPYAMVVNNSSTPYSIGGGGGGAINGAAELIKLGTGTLTLDGANTFTGGVNIKDGTVVVASLASPGPLGAGGLTLGGSGTTPTAGTLQYTGGSTGANRTIVLAGSGGTLDIDGANVTISGIVSGTGALTKKGAGILDLSAAGNTLAGSITVEQGTLKTGGLGEAPSGTLLTLGTGATSALFQYSGAANVTSGLGVTIPTAGTIKVNTAGTVLTLGGPVSGPTLVKDGPGELKLPGAVTFTGSTHTVTAGTLNLAGNANTVPGTFTLNTGTTLAAGSGAVATSAALGASAVTLNGGTLTLNASVAAAFSGFGGDGTGYTRNGSAIMSGTDVVQLTDAVTDNQAGSIFRNAQVNTNAFTAKFTVQVPAGSGNPADGGTFVIQNDPRGATALGGAGGSLGYAGITPSAAFEWSIYNTTNTNTRFATNGATGGYTASTLNFKNGTPVDVTVMYDGATLTAQLQETRHNNVYNLAGMAVDLATLLGSGQGYVGFTASNGGEDAQELISDFQWFDPTAVVEYGNDVTVSANSTVNSTAGRAGLGSLSFADSDLALTVNGSARFADTSLPVSGAYTFNVAGGNLLTGPIADGGLTVILNKTGSGGLVLDNTASDQLIASGTASSIAVAGGQLIAVGSGDAGAKNPLGTATVALNTGAGGLILSSKSGSLTFDNAVAVNANATIVARQIESGVAGPLTVSLGSTGAVPNGVTVAAGATATLSSLHNYTLEMKGAIGGRRERGRRRRQRRDAAGHGQYVRGHRLGDRRDVVDLRSELAAVGQRHQRYRWHPGRPSGQRRPVETDPRRRGHAAHLDRSGHGRLARHGHAQRHGASQHRQSAESAHRRTLAGHRQHAAGRRRRPDAGRQRDAQRHRELRRQCDQQSRHHRHPQRRRRHAEQDRHEHADPLRGELVGQQRHDRGRRHVERRSGQFTRHRRSCR